MKFARLDLDHGPSLVAMTSDGGVLVRDVLEQLRPLGSVGNDLDVIDVLTDAEAMERLGVALAEIPDPLLMADETTRTLRPVRRVPRILAIGLNYRDHATEVGIELPQAPLLFARWASSLADPYADVVIPGDIVAQLDYEVELVAVIGRPVKRAGLDEAAAAICGWTVANDLSARDLQFADGQWTRGKNLDGTCPVGPVVVPADELDPGNLGIRCWVGEDLRQDSSTDQMVFTPTEILAHLSATMRIEPGDLVLTGTPAGVALGSPTPQWLTDGQVVRCEVDGIGATHNQIRFDPRPSLTG